MPVEYPAGFNSDAMACSLGLSGCPFPGTPARIGYRPVSSAAREGAQTGAAAYQFVKRVPEAASPSILGVLRSVAPQTPISWQPRSSARKMMKFGLRDGLRVCARAPVAAADDRKSLRVNMPNMLSQERSGIVGDVPAGGTHAPGRLLLSFYPKTGTGATQFVTKRSGDAILHQRHIERLETQQ